MPAIGTIFVDHTLHDKQIEIVEGDITAPGPEETVDVLVISAFPDDYEPTDGSVIGALASKGLSVGELATRKECDLRRDFSCWLSAPIDATHRDLRARRILCFEPAFRNAAPAEVVEDIFRALAPFIGAEPRVTSVAMPLVTCGDQETPVEKILEPLVRAAAHWMRTSPLHHVRIVERSPVRAQQLREAFGDLNARIMAEQTGADKQFDVFLSYCHDNAATADLVIQTLRAMRPDIRVFRDTEVLRTGGDLRVQLDRAIRSSRRFVPLLSREYVASGPCKDEFNAAWNIREQHNASFFFPIRAGVVELADRRMKHLLYQDCVDASPAKVERACALLLKNLPAA